VIGRRTLVERRHAEGKLRQLDCVQLPPLDCLRLRQPADKRVTEPDPLHGDDYAELRACANGHIDHTSGLIAVIDGVPVQDLAAQSLPRQTAARVWLEKAVAKRQMLAIQTQSK
jgi:hypothetical protein